MVFTIPIKAAQSVNAQVSDTRADAMKTSAGSIKFPYIFLAESDTFATQTVVLHFGSVGQLT